MSILTVGTSVRKDASTSRRPFFERSKNTHSARSSISHPQLRDLLICPTKSHHVQTVSEKGLDAHVFGQYTMRIMDTNFLPNCLVTGCGYVAMGGENADLLIRSVDVQSRWELKIFTGQSIVNSVCFYQASSSGNPQVLICNNDQTITQYDLSAVSSIQNAALDSLSADPAHRPTPLGTRRRNYVSGDRDGAVAGPGAGDEKPMLTHKDSIILPVPVNHCSVSPDSRAMVAVGDSNEVFLYDCQSAHGSNEPLVSDWRACARKITLPGVSPSTGSFSTSWSQHGDKFAVASEGEVVVVYDMKMLGKPLLVKHTSQNGRSGAARVVKFSPEGPNELLAFTEHQSLVHVLDARTFDPDHEETLTVPTPLPGMNPIPPRLSPESIRNDSSHERRVNLRGGAHSASSSGQTHLRRISRLNAQLNGTSHLRASRDIDAEDEEQEEEEEAESEDAMADRPARAESGSSMDFVPQSGNSRIFERLWGEMQDGEDAHEPISSLERIYLRRVGTRATGGRGGFSWSVRSMLGGSAEDEVCLDGEGESSEERRVEASARAAPGPRTGWDSVTSSGREIQLRGSSIRLLAADNERAAHPIIEHRAGASASMAGIHSQLIRNRLGQPPTVSQGWFDLGSTAGVAGMSGQPMYGGSIGVNSGMWDDLIGLSWSPDGEWLVCGTEAGLVEWKVKRSSRTGFGDVRLC